MVSSIVPGMSGVTTGAVDARLGRIATPATQQESAAIADRIDTKAALNALRESVRSALQQVHQTLAIGHDAQAVLVRAQGMVRDGAGGAALSELLNGYQARVEAHIAQGARLAGGENVVVEAETGAPVTISGVDLKLNGNGPIKLSLSADGSESATELQRALEALQPAMGRLLDAARALEAHQGFISAAEGAGVRHDLDADGARLLALQARQGLEKAGVGAIANVEPQAVLSLFRA